MAFTLEHKIVFVQAYCHSGNMDVLNTTAIDQLQFKKTSDRNLKLMGIEI